MVASAQASENQMLSQTDLSRGKTPHTRTISHELKNQSELKIKTLENGVVVLNLLREAFGGAMQRRHKLVIPGLASDGSPLPPPILTMEHNSADSEVTSSIMPDDSVLEALAFCESSGNWQINTGNGYYGGLQFDLQTWQGVGGVGYPHEATKEEQIHRGKILFSQRGWAPWPGCRKKLGLP